MIEKSPHLGSSFESWLDEQGLREDVTGTAIKAVIAFQLTEAMKEKGLTRTEMAAQIKTSRAQLARLLDPDNPGVTLETLQKAARIVGRSLRLELV